MPETRSRVHDLGTRDKGWYQPLPPMDVLFLNSSVFDIPSSRRVGAIVHDGAADLQLWPGPSFDRELRDKYGPGLQQALDVERRRLGADHALGDVVRLHPGRLHCDWLAWVVTRLPEPGSTRQPAPTAATLEAAVLSVLKHCAGRNVARVAFPALGDGPQEMPKEERITLVVEVARRYEDDCFATGTAPVVEEVFVCEPSAKVLQAAKRKVARLAKSDFVEPAAKPKTARRAKATGTRKPRGKAVRRLAEEALDQGRSLAIPYNQGRRFSAGEWVAHPKFGLGRVELTTPDQKMEILFESGAVKMLVHDRG